MYRRFWLVEKLMLILSHELSYWDTPTYYRNYFEHQINMAAIASDTFANKKSIFIPFKRTFESFLKWFIMHVRVELLTVLLADWIFSKLYVYANKLRAKSRFELESPICNKWALFFELPGFFYICICILLHFFFSNKNYSQVLYWTSIGINKILFHANHSYPPCSESVKRYFAFIFMILRYTV